MSMPDTTNAKSGEFPPITSAWYEVKFSDYEEKRDKNGDLYLEVMFDFVEGKRKAWTNLSYRDDFRWQLKTFKGAVGASDSEEEIEPYKGSRLEIYCENRKYNGKNQINVKEFRKYGQATSNIPPPEPRIPKDDLDWVK
jgi:hypothetical protein